MEYGIIKNIVIGKVRTYTELRSEVGYCFYDVDAEERNHLTYIVTPILDETELDRKFKVVYGDAEKLNDELQKQSQEQMSQN